MEINTFERAAVFFILNRCSFSGLTCAGGFSQESSEKRLTDSSIEKLRHINLSNIEFFNEDYPTFLNHFPKNSFLFLDPPYFLQKMSNLYGMEGQLHKNFNHEAFAKIIMQYNHWLLCYNNCDTIIKLYSYPDNTIHQVSWSYGMSNDKKSKEIVILHTIRK